MRNFILYHFYNSIYMYYKLYIKGDFDSLNTFGKIYLFFPWLIRSMINIYIYPVWLITFYVFTQSKIFKYLEETYKIKIVE